MLYLPICSVLTWEEPTLPGKAVAQIPGWSPASNQTLTWSESKPHSVADHKVLHCPRFLFHEEQHLLLCRLMAFPLLISHGRGHMSQHHLREQLLQVLKAWWSHVSINTSPEEHWSSRAAAIHRVRTGDKRPCWQTGVSSVRDHGDGRWVWSTMYWGRQREPGSFSLEERCLR